MSTYSFYDFKHSNRIKQLRTNKHLTLKELGKQVGLRDNTLSQYETGKRNPSKESWEKLANFFDVDVDYLTGRSNIIHDPFNQLVREIQSLNLDDDSKKKLKDIFAIVFDTFDDKISDLESEIDDLKNRSDPDDYYE